jgi:hypothetical protein
MEGELKKCDLCRETYTSTHCEVAPGHLIYVCGDCLEQSKAYFIFVCMNCGTVHKRHKKAVINSLRDQGLKKAYMLCEGMQIIQGVDICISCDPQGILEYWQMGFC